MTRCACAPSLGILSMAAGALALPPLLQAGEIGFRPPDFGTMSVYKVKGTYRAGEGIAGENVEIEAVCFTVGVKQEDKPAVAYVIEPSEARFFGPAPIGVLECDADRQISTQHLEHGLGEVLGFPVVLPSAMSASDIKPGTRNIKLLLADQAVELPMEITAVQDDGRLVVERKLAKPDAEAALKFGKAKTKKWTETFTLDPQTGALIAAHRDMELQLGEGGNTMPLAMKCFSRREDHKTLSEEEFAKIQAGINDYQTKWLKAGGDVEAARKQLEAFKANYGETFLKAAVPALEAKVGFLQQVADQMKADRAQYADLIDKPAPPFTLKNLAGEEVSLAGLKGKIVLLNFFGVRCPPCVEELPQLSKLHDEFAGKGAMVVSINAWEEPAKLVKDLWEQKKLTQPVLLGGAKLAIQYKVNGVPCTYVIGPDGKVVTRTNGYFPGIDQQLRYIVEAQLGKVGKEQS